MTTPVITFFNHKGGVGKTSLVYHLSWMFGEIGRRVVAVDLDPQANLTSAFLTEDEIEALWNKSDEPNTIYRAVKPLTEFGDLLEPRLSVISDDIHLIPGDLALSGFEETVSEAWPSSTGDKHLYRPFRILTAFWQIAQTASKQVDADLILFDVGPHLGATNRSALIATDFVVIPLGADLFSLQGLENLGPTLRSWQSQWKNRVDHWPNPAFDLPGGTMKPLGYLLQQHRVRLSRPVKAYDRWINRMADVYHRSILGEKETGLTPAHDPYCLATLKHYRSLVHIAQEARKPIFKLTPADGAIGNHSAAVHDAYLDFKSLAETILKRINAL